MYRHRRRPRRSVPRPRSSARTNRRRDSASWRRVSSSSWRHSARSESADVGILVTGIVVGAAGVPPAPAPAGARADRRAQGLRAPRSRPPTAPRADCARQRAAGSSRRGPHLDEPTDVERSPSSSPSVFPSGTARRPSARRSNRCWPRRSRTGSSSSPTTSRPTGRRRSAPRSRLETSVFAMSRRAATSRFTRTSVQRSTTRAARTSGGTETTTGWSRSMPSAPSRRSKQIAGGPFSARPSSSTTATARPLPVNDPIPVLGGVDSPDAGTRVRALLHLLQNGGHLGIDPVYSLVRRDVAARTGLQGSIRDGDFVYSCEMALLGPFVHVPEVLAHRRLLPVPVDRDLEELPPTRAVDPLRRPSRRRA